MDAVSRLPAELLAGDRASVETVRIEKEALPSKIDPCRLSFPAEFPYDFDSPVFTSSLSSPGDSTETDESSDDEEDFLAGLTRRLALSTPRLVVPSFTVDKADEKSRVIASSPQSTLSGLGSWSASGNGSPNAPSSRLPSPPATPFCSKDDTLDLISAAAGQVARMKISEEAHTSISSQASKFHLQPYRSPDRLKQVESLSNASIQHNQRFQRNYATKEQVCSTLWGRQMKDAYVQGENQNQEHCHIQRRTSGITGNENGARYVRPFNLCHSVWPPVPQQPPAPRPLNPSVASVGSGLHAGSVVKRQSTGTGVFLPRRYGNPPEPRKKSGCSPVLVPAKVIHALNMNLDEMEEYATSRFNPGLASDYCDTLMARRNAFLAEQRKGPRLAHGALSREIPPLAYEWNY